MAGALVICLSAAAALLAVIKNTHARVKQPPNLWLIPLVSPRVCHLYDGAALNLVWTKHTNLNSYLLLTTRMKLKPKNRKMTIRIMLKH